MFSTGDLLPQQSGSASIGVNFRNGAPTSTILPYNNIHFVSGVIHDPILGVSGVIRFAKNFGEVSSHIPLGIFRGFELSADGGKTFGLKIGSTEDLLLPGTAHAIISGPDNADSYLYVLTSGNFECHSQSDYKVIAIDDIFFNSKSITLDAEAGSLTIESLFDTQVNTDEDFIVIALDNATIRAGQSNQEGGQIQLDAFNASGRLQYRFGPHQAWYAKLTHSNTGGPANDGFWPLPHSGQIAQMIAQGGGGSQSLQVAYDGGDQINLRRDNNDRNVGVVLREQNGVAQFDLSQPAAQAHLNYGIAVSGGTGANGFALTKLVPNGIYIKSSGIPSISESFLSLGYITGAPQSAFIAANHDLNFFAFRNIFYTAGTVNQPGGQINLAAFQGSGQIEYRNGPFTAWHVRARNNTNSVNGGPNGDGFHPIANSGQVNLMILRAIKTKAITIERPAVNNDLTMWYTNEPITITEVESVLRGSFDASGQFSIRYSGDRSQVGTELTTLPITCTNRTTGQITTSFIAPAIPADNWIWIGVSGVSGVATNQLNITIQYQ